MSGGRLSIGVKIGDSLYEDTIEVRVGVDGFETSEHIAQGLEELARQIRRQAGALKAQGSVAP